MIAKTIFKGMTAFVTTVTLAACGGTGIEGNWVESVPGIENQVQGVSLEKGGKASSINMATLQYEKWEKKDGNLILSGKSIGNHQTVSFTDTLVIEKLTAEELILKKGELIRKYQKQ